MAYDALQKAYFIEIIKLYDRTKGAYSIEFMLKCCKENINSFQNIDIL